jgi:type IV pilus assembly protein PilB
MDGLSSDIKDILLKGDYVTQEDIKKATDYAATHHATVLEYLLEQGIITKALLGQAYAEFYNLPFVDLAINPPSKDHVLKIPQEVADKYHVVVAKQDEDGMVIATDNPAQEGLNESLKKLFPKTKFSIAFAVTEDILENFIHYQQSLEARFIKIITDQKKVAPEILEEILKDALFYRVSDVHFEPREERVFTRFRIDGVMHEVGSFPKIFYENVLNRVKVQAQMKIDDHFSAQDGAIRFVHDGSIIDARVSIVPTLNGEKVVMRLLSEYLRTLNLAELGLNEKDYSIITNTVKKPFGMILVTGPTGSGKTTTLYGLLKLLSQPEVNIMTIEDPVEYKVVTINQIQVNNSTNLSFAKGLRSIVRQDPDIILVGEIRDRETAEVGINAALTGHLLLSSFHANDAAAAIPRLLDMGVEPYLAASTLELIAAQRLLRRICDNCRYSVSVSLAEISKLMPNAKAYFSRVNTLYAGKGCQACNFTGFKGRVAIFELIQMTQSMRELIVKIPSAEEVWLLAKKQGARSLFEDGMEKVKSGISTIAELLRVAPPMD